MIIRKFTAAMLTATLVLAIAVASCGGIGGGGTFTITDIPEKYNGKYATFGGVKLGSAWAVTGAERIDKKEAVLCKISNGSVTLPTWKCSGSDGTTYQKIEKYSGSDSLIVTVAISDKNEMSGTGTPETKDTIGGVMFMSIKFTNGSATASWKDGLGTDLGDMFKGLGSEDGGVDLENLLKGLGSNEEGGMDLEGLLKGLGL